MPARRALVPALALAAALGLGACSDGGMTADEEGSVTDGDSGGSSSGGAAGEGAQGTPAQAPNLESSGSGSGTVDPAAVPGSATGDPDIQPSPTFEPQEDDPDAINPTD